MHGLQYLQHLGLGVVAHGLIYSVARGIFLDQGLNPVPRISSWVLIHCATREVLIYNFLVICVCGGVGSHMIIMTYGKNLT